MDKEFDRSDALIEGMTMIHSLRNQEWDRCNGPAATQLTHIWKWLKWWHKRENS